MGRSGVGGGGVDVAGANWPVVFHALLAKNMVNEGLAWEAFG